MVEADPGAPRPPGVAAAVELTTVADDEAVFHDGAEVRRHRGLRPDHEYRLEGIDLRTLPAPGALLSRFATVNDVHLGEIECGVIEGLDIGPVLRARPGEPPYPETMNRGAITEMDEAGIDTVVVKGDLTADGTHEQYQQFLSAYRGGLGDRMHHIRGNHDAYHGEDFADTGPFHIDLPGVRIAVIDTTIPGWSGGGVTDATLEWLDDISAGCATPVIALGHHHVWSPDSGQRPDGYFGVNPDDSERLVELVAKRTEIVGYFAGHTHRNRVRYFSATGGAPWAEVACTKDYPGAWAEYRVFEGGILQIMRRVSSPEALDWTERTKAMFGGTYGDYALGALHERCFAIWPR